MEKSLQTAINDALSKFDSYDFTNIDDYGAMTIYMDDLVNVIVSSQGKIWFRFFDVFNNLSEMQEIVKIVNTVDEIIKEKS